MNFITLENLKEELNITESSDDEILDKFIKRTSGIIEDYIWYTLDQRIITEYHNWWDIILFAELPIADEASVVITNKDTWDSYTIDFINWRAISLIQTPPEWSNNIKLEYQTWYDDESKIPEALIFVAIEWIWEYYMKYKSQIWDWNQDLQVKSKKIDSLSITYFSQEESKKSDIQNNFEILDGYKLKDFI